MHFSLNQIIRRSFINIANGSFRALGAEDLQASLYWRKSVLSPSYPGPSDPLGACPKRPMDKPPSPVTTATAGSDVVQSGRPIFDDFFQHLWPYIGNNTANVVFQMIKRLWLIRIDQ
ncbi:hypothetical protein TNCV_1070411 [Trichonephila clavipes]|nr:hypothetical protein TNCV_1070411 [Trichonephila clavipes]